MTRRLLIALLLTVFAVSLPGDDGSATKVLIVRHAEKAKNPADDPPLTNAGRNRARALWAAVKKAGVDTIVATNRVRTQQTVEPAATALRLEPRIFDIRDVDGIVEAIKGDYQGQVVLLAGHSGTVPRIIEGLGAGAIPAIEETVYDNLFVVIVEPSGEAHAVRLKYGEASADE